MNEKQKAYSTILRTLPATDARTEVLFRQAGDGFLQIEYGHEQRLYVPDSFRILAIDAKVKEKGIDGLIETVPGLRTNMFHFDPLILPVERLIDEIAECEDQLNSLDNMVIPSRLIRLPVAFEDTETKNIFSLSGLTRLTVKADTIWNISPSVTASLSKKRKKNLWKPNGSTAAVDSGPEAVFSGRWIPDALWLFPNITRREPGLRKVPSAWAAHALLPIQHRLAEVIS